MIAAGPAAASVTLPAAREPLGLRRHLDERGQLDEVGLGDRRHEQRLVARDGEADVGPLELAEARPVAHPQTVHGGVLT